MKLIIYNGSPRGKKSNTKLLMDEFIKGMYAQGEYDVELFYLASKSDMLLGSKAFVNADSVILAFPLYTDSMPGLVKEFIEMLEPFTAREKNPRIGFVVQSGFPEAAHSRFVEKYLKNLAQRWKSDYLGTIVKGGVEGIQIMPASMTRKLFKRFYKLGAYFARNGSFDHSIIKKLTPFENFSKSRIVFFKLMQRTGFANFYWDSQLKQNKAFDRRFERPMAPGLDNPFFPDL